MKKIKYKKIIIPAIILFVLLVIANRYFTKDIKDLQDNKEIAIQTNSKTVKKYSLKDFTDITTEFNATYKRKVGPAIDKQYTGIPLSTIISNSNIKLNDSDTVSIIAQDQYQIDLTVSEVNESNNAYIVIKENSSLLSNEQGPYMIVLRKDELSTRWVKQIVKINININKEH